MRGRGGGGGIEGIVYLYAVAWTDKEMGIVFLVLKTVVDLLDKTT
jgi:hypothetical protein